MSELTDAVKQQIEAQLVKPKPLKETKPKLPPGKRGGQPEAKAFTKKKQKEFLELLRQTCNLSGSARAVGIHPQTVYSHKRKDEKFAALVEEAQREAIEGLEGEAWRRAKDGVSKPVFYKGQQCGTMQEYSDSLMITLLKANLPEKYNTSHQSIDLNSKETVEISGAKLKLLSLLGLESSDIIEGEFTEGD